MASQAVSEDFGGQPEPYPESLWAWLSDQGSKNRDQLAFYAYNSQKRVAASSLNYGQLIDRVESLAVAWTGSGVVARDRVLVFLDNAAAEHWTILFWLAVRLGLTFVPLDPSVIKRPKELTSMVELHQPRVVVAQDVDCARAWDDMEFAQAPSLQLLCKRPTQECGRWKTLDALQALDGPAPHPTMRPDDVAIVMNTSGSTSLPKCCPITTRNLVSEIRQYHSMHLSRLTTSTRHLVSISVSRPIAYLACVNTWRGGGATVFSDGSFDVSTTFNMINDMACTHAWFVPAMINILHAAREKAAGLDSLQTVFMSGDAAEKVIIEKARALLPPSCHFIPSWGMSEGAPLFGYSRAENIAFESTSSIAGVGRAFRGTRVRICESGSKTLLERGKQGELHVNSDSTIDFYLGNRSEEDFYNDESGRWFKTGDTAVMDASGVIFIVGRTKDIIVYKGRNIVPTVVQSYLKDRFPGEWVVVGLKDEVHGEVPAAVAKKLPVAREEVLDYCRHANIEDSGLAGGIYILKELGLEDWPYNSMNKIQKRDLVGAIERSRA